MHCTVHIHFMVQSLTLTVTCLLSLFMLAESLTAMPYSSLSLNLKLMSLCIVVHCPRPLLQQAI